MNQFVFEKKQKNVLGAFIAVGILSMILSYFMDSGTMHMRFWTNYLHNTVFFLGIAFIITFVLHAKVLLYSGWHVAFKRVWEAYAQFLLVGLILMLPVIIGVWGHFHHLYHWADPEAMKTDKILQGKSSFLNPVWYTVGTLGIVGVWYFFFAKKYRALSIDEDNNPDAEYSQHKKIKFNAAVFLPIAAFSSAALIWQWIMSLDAHWYSTMYAWYSTASWWVSAVALTILTLIYLKSKGYMDMVTTEHLHDLGKYMFAFSIFWTYLWFSQYMLIWYANVGEETTYFHLRMRKFPVLFYGNLILNFVLPFLILMRNDTKRKYGTLALTAGIVFFGHWFDFFQMVKPGTWLSEIEHAKHANHEPSSKHVETANLEQGMNHDSHKAGAEHNSTAESHEGTKISKWGYPEGFVNGVSFPGFLELGTFLGFIGLFFYFVFGQLEKASLVPKNNPYIEETAHHHVM
jgi:hypothetical protein